MITAEVLADSINTNTGDRLTTFLVTFPRFILAEVNTHRMLSRNSASSRAIPVRKRIAQVRENPFVPMAFGANQRGMQAGAPVDDQDAARALWLSACSAALERAELLADLGVHKQHANRLLEPYAWHTAIISGTEWRNFFALRDHPDAQPEFGALARAMREAMQASAPETLAPWSWHLPMLRPDELGEARIWEEGVRACLPNAADELLRWVQISAGRCARVSYETHDGRRDVEADVSLCRDRLVPNGHLSPLEHPARVSHSSRWFGNFKGFRQYRKFVPHEEDFSLVRPS